MRMTIRLLVNSQLKNRLYFLKDLKLKHQEVYTIC